DKDADEIRSISSDELKETRPNRWTGAPSTWRHYIQAEHDTYQALEGVRSRDLSIHLYNAFALKKKIREGESWAEDEDSDRKGKAWTPGVSWTAWPLRADEVPAAGLLNATNDGDDILTSRRDEVHSASRNLEEDISATILRLAKEKFLKRDLASRAKAEESNPDKMSSGRPEPMDLDHPKAQMLDDGETAAADFAEPIQEEVDDTHSTAELLQPDGPVATANEMGIPAPSSNDDLSYKLIRPSARSIIEHLNKTLGILHNARLAGLGNLSDSSEEDSQEEPEEPEEPRVSKKRKGKQKPTTEDDEPEDEKDTSNKTNKRRHKIGKHAPWRAGGDYPKGYLSKELYYARKLRRWELRDWRAVMGAASLGGFPPEVIARATQRCADLFGAEMSIHTLPEVPAESTLATRKTATYRPGIGLDLSHEDSDSDIAVTAPGRRRSRSRSVGGLEKTPAEAARPLEPVPQSTTKASTTGKHLCPHSECPRASRGFDRLNNLTRHVNTQHGGKWEVAQPSTPTFGPSGDESDHHAQSSRSRSGTPARTHYCPYPDCKRTVVGFDRRGNLLRHLDLVHGEEHSRTAGSDVDSTVDSMDEMDGAVHVDGFLKPIKLRPGQRGADQKPRLSK
ncbi:hypothetical protein GQ53DRAFT_602748, partial [Thozetella sp. PMI_491]